MGGCGGEAGVCAPLLMGCLQPHGVLGACCRAGCRVGSALDLGWVQGGCRAVRGLLQCWVHTGCRVIAMLGAG